MEYERGIESGIWGHSMIVDDGNFLLRLLSSMLETIKEIDPL